MIHTNRCKNCGREKGSHFSDSDGESVWCYASGASHFTDSGLAALDAHKEELYNAIAAFRDSDGTWGDIIHVLNQIDKEK